jgi:hypothetical protein
MMKSGESPSMNNKCSIVLALFAGVLGGALTRYITPPSAFAQNNQSTAPKEIRAQSVTLVDDQNRIVGTFMVAADAGWQSANQGRRRIVLRDSQGHEIWSAGGTNFRYLTTR